MIRFDLAGRMMHRSYLFVPGNRPERFQKALTSGADAVILDLEDAVAPDAKHTARDAVAAWLASSPSPALHVRINSAGTPWFEDDIQMCSDLGVQALLLPKAERPCDIAHITARTRGRTKILPIIESAQGMWHAIELARSGQVERLVFGSIDFQHDLSISADEHELLHARSQLVLVSRVAGLSSPVDGVTVAIHDADQLRADAVRARRLGFGAKLCIHPAQVDGINAYFRPNVKELAWAQRVIDAAVTANGAAIAVDGQMVDRPVLARAQSMLAEAARRNSI